MDELRWLGQRWERVTYLITILHESRERRTRQHAQKANTLSLEEKATWHHKLLDHDGTTGFPGSAKLLAIWGLESRYRNDPSTDHFDPLRAI